MANAEPGAGDVPITLAGEQLTLVPSLEACRTISKLAGDSLGQAIARCNRLDFDFLVEVIALGLSATSPALKKQIQDKVYHTGVISVAADCILFIRTVMNGGRRPEEDESVASADLLERLVVSLPEEVVTEFGEMLERLHRVLAAKVEEAGEKAEDPLAESESRLESSTAS